MIIIDGHNLIGASKIIKLYDPEAKIKLLELIERYYLAKKERIIVVFDKINNFEYERNDYHDIEVRYPLENMDADKVIKDLLSINKNSCRLVSNDNELIDAAKEHKINVIKCEDFLDKIERIIKDKSSDYKIKPILKDETQKWLDIFNKKDI